MNEPESRRCCDRLHRRRRSIGCRRVMDGAVVEHCDGASWRLVLSDARVVRAAPRRSGRRVILAPQYVLPAEAHEPDVAAREAAALLLAEQIEVPTPTLLGSDLRPALEAGDPDGADERARRQTGLGATPSSEMVRGVSPKRSSHPRCAAADSQRRQAYAPFQQSSYEPPAGLATSRRSGSAPSESPRAHDRCPAPLHPSRLPSRQRAVEQEPDHWCGRLATRQHRPHGRRRRPQPIEPVLLRRSSGRVVHDHLGTSYRRRLSPLGRHRRHHRCARPAPHPAASVSERDTPSTPRWQTRSPGSALKPTGRSCVLGRRG